MVAILSNICHLFRSYAWRCPMDSSNTWWAAPENFTSFPAMARKFFLLN